MCQVKDEPIKDWIKLARYNPNLKIGDKVEVLIEMVYMTIKIM